VDAASAQLHAEGIDVKPPAMAPYGMKQVFFHGSDLCFPWKANGLL